MNEIANFVKLKRSQLGLTQAELALKAGVGLRFVRDLEQKTKPLRSDKINQVLALFGRTLGPVPIASRNHEADAND